MTEKERFMVEMMDTPTLAAHCQRLVAAIDAEADRIYLGYGSPERKRRLMSDLEVCRKILNSRQMRLF